MSERSREFGFASGIERHAMTAIGRQTMKTWGDRPNPTITRFPDPLRSADSDLLRGARIRGALRMGALLRGAVPPT